MCRHFIENQHSLGPKSQNTVLPSVLPKGNQDRWQYIVLTLNNKIENQTKIDKLKYPVTCRPRPPATLLWLE
jgi:hypothetical protein